METHQSHTLRPRTKIWATIFSTIIFSNFKFGDAFGFRSLTPKPGPDEVYIRESTGFSRQWYNISFCNNATAPKVYEIITGATCINLYSKSNCEGGLIRFHPAPQIYSNTYTNLDSHHWIENETTVTKETMRIGSLGPCYDACDPRNWEGFSDDPVKVTFYQDNDYRERGSTLEVKRDECAVIPDPYTTARRSIKISGNRSSSCVELHYAANCGGDYSILRPGYPHLHNIGFWGTGRSGVIRGIFAKAVSRCGSFCNKTVPDVNPTPFSKPPGENVITVFDSDGFYGNPTNIDLSDGRCVSLANHSVVSVSVGSIQTYGQCVMLYMLTNCTERWGYYSLMANGGKSGLDSHVDMILSHTYPHFRLTSLRLCNNQTEKGRLETTDDQFDGRISQGGCEISANSSILVSYWEMAIILFGFILLMCFSALAGARLTRYYDVVNRTTNSEEFNVIYTIQP